MIEVCGETRHETCEDSSTVTEIILIDAFWQDDAWYIGSRCLLSGGQAA